MPTITAAQKWHALLQQRCPRCCEGRIYEGGMRMHKSCPVCHLVFEREPGYFMGALYISYGMSSIILMLGLLVCHLLAPDWNLAWFVLILAILYLPFVPMMTRYARVLWIYFDRWAWPTPPGEAE